MCLQGLKTAHFSLKFETCVVYVYVYLLAVVFFPVFPVSSLHLQCPSITCRSVEQCETLGRNVNHVASVHVQLCAFAHDKKVKTAQFTLELSRRYCFKSVSILF